MRTNIRVGAIITQGEKLLLIHRKKKGDEYWVLVGGGLEEGETMEETLKREVMEETALEVLNYKKIIETSDVVATQVIYKCEVGAGEPTLGGPEKSANSQENWFNLEWVEICKVAEIDDLYPIIIKQWAKDRINQKV